LSAQHVRVGQNSSLRGQEERVTPHSRRELLDMIRRHRMQEAGPVFARDQDFAAP
jgi:hypothetical protein